MGDGGEAIGVVGAHVAPHRIRQAAHPKIVQRAAVLPRRRDRRFAVDACPPCERALARGATAEWRGRLRSAEPAVQVLAQH